MSEATEKIVYVQVTASGGWQRIKHGLLLLLAICAVIWIAKSLQIVDVTSTTVGPPLVATIASRPAAPAQAPLQVIQAPVLPTAFVRVPAEAPVRVVPEPLPTVVPTVAPTDIPPIYPSAGMKWEVRMVRDRGYEQQCVYVLSLNKRTCVAPNNTISEASASWITGMMEAGNISGEAIP